MINSFLSNSIYRLTKIFCRAHSSRNKTHTNLKCSNSAWTCANRIFGERNMKQLLCFTVLYPIYIETIRVARMTGSFLLIEVNVMFENYKTMLFCLNSLVRCAVSIVLELKRICQGDENRNTKNIREMLAAGSG